MTSVERASAFPELDRRPRARLRKIGPTCLASFLVAILVSLSHVACGQTREEGNRYSQFVAEMEASIVRPSKPLSDDDRRQLLDALAPLFDYLRASPSEVPKCRLLLLQRGVDRTLQKKVGVFDVKPKVYEEYMSRIDREVDLFYEEIGQIRKSLGEEGKRER